MTPASGLPPLIVFDLDDTIVDHAGAEAPAQRETYDAFPGLFDGVPFEAWRLAYRAANTRLWGAYGRGEIGRPDLHARRFGEPMGELGIDPSRVDEVAEFYLSRYPAHWRLNEGAEEVLEAASRLGTVGILSNGFKELVRAKVARFRLDRWAKVVVVSEEVGFMKPDRRIFDAALEAAGGGERRKVYVGDSYEHDVLGAKGAGWLPILYLPDGDPPPHPLLWIRRLLDAEPLLG